jgi:hypothetical protein
MAANDLIKFIKKYDMKTSSSKIEAMGFCGRNIN